MILCALFFHENVDQSYSKQPMHVDDDLVFGTNSSILKSRHHDVDRHCPVSSGVGRIDPAGVACSLLLLSGCHGMM